jgi:hypothetical protein
LGLAANLAGQCKNHLVYRHVPPSALRPIKCDRSILARSTVRGRAIGRARRLSESLSGLGVRFCTLRLAGP